MAFPFYNQHDAMDCGPACLRMHNIRLLCNHIENIHINLRVNYVRKNIRL